MEITEIRINLPTEELASDQRLRAFCNITFDDAFVVRDLKIIASGHRLFVAMPARKRTFACPTCLHQNSRTANYCNRCGRSVKSISISMDDSSRNELFADIAHPINAEMRTKIVEKVLQAYETELRLSKLPDHHSNIRKGEDAA